MKVLKFGGSSVANADKIRMVADIVKGIPGQKVLVFSAMKGITDLLLGAAQLASTGDLEYRTNIDTILKKQLDAIKDLLPQGADIVTNAIEGMISELSDILHGVELIRECSARTKDYIASFGERMNCMLIAAFLDANGTRAEYVDAREIIRTDDSYGRGEVDFSISNKQVAERLAAIDGIPVVTGFIGSTANGITTTLGRNGSDYSASIIGAAVNAEAVEIWTDVDGVLSADPRIVPGAHVVSDLSVEEAMELSFFGAEVIHPYTMIPAVDQEIPIWIKNTLNPKARGSVIAKDVPRHDKPITGLASISDVALINVEGGGLLGTPGIGMKIFAAIAHAKVNVIMISQASSEHSVCLVVRENQVDNAVAALEAELEHELKNRMVQSIDVKRDLEIVAAVGENMRGRPGISGLLFSAIGEAGISVLAIAQGSSERNISFVIKRSDRERVLNIVHEAFFSREVK